MFYKLLDNTNLIFGPEVISAEYQLLADEKDSYTYPINSWYWFDTEAQAREYFGLPTEET